MTGGPPVQTCRAERRGARAEVLTYGQARGPEGYPGRANVDREGAIASPEYVAL
jgi:hypothetical protein